MGADCFQTSRARFRESVFGCNWLQKTDRPKRAVCLKPGEVELREEVAALLEHQRKIAAALLIERQIGGLLGVEVLAVVSLEFTGRVIQLHPELPIMLEDNEMKAFP